VKSAVLWDVTACNPVKLTYVSEEVAASVFRVEEESKQQADMEGANSSETSVYFCLTTLRHIPEDSILQRTATPTKHVTLRKLPLVLCPVIWKIYLGPRDPLSKFSSFYLKTGGEPVSETSYILLFR
jgi:hypothetical protein